MIAVRGVFDTLDSYGILATEIASALVRLGEEVVCVPMGIDAFYGEHGPAFHPLITPRLRVGEIFPWELVILPPEWCCRNVDKMSKYRVHLTTFESPRIPLEWVSFENNCIAVGLICEGNMVGFSASGVTSDMFVLPCGYNPDNTYYTPMNMEGSCVFGIAGNLGPQGSGSRKGVENAISLFQRAFPSEEDVKLLIKVHYCRFPEVSDSRVSVINECYTPKQIGDWYRQLTCYLNLSKSEGWGLMPWEAMLTGRPIISTRFLGLTEFFVPEFGYPVEGTFEKAYVIPDDYYPGVWCNPKEDEVIESMRAVYKDREQAAKKGRKASEFWKFQTWDWVAKRLLDKLHSLGLH